MNHNTARRIALMAGAAMLVLPVSAIAQPAASPSAAAADAATVPEIVVTAQRRSESLHDVPLSITAITGDNLAKLGVASTADLAKVVPGFTVAQTFTGSPVYTLRGIGMNDNTLGAGPTVAVYVDEAPLPFAVMTRGASFDLERVEVLKGPQGTLYGLNSTGGAINYISAKPSATTTAGGTVSYSRFNTADLNAYVSAPITDTLRFRLAGQTTQGGDWQQSATRNDSLGRTDFLQGRAQLQWEPAPGVKLLATANGWRDRSDSQAAQLVAVLPQNPANTAAVAALSAQPITSGRSNRIADWDPGVSYRNHDWFYQFSLRADVDLSPSIKLTSLTGYDRYRQRETRDIDGTALQNLLLNPDGELKSFTQELRLTGNSGPLKWIAGANYERDEASEFQVFHNLYQTNNAPVGIPILQADLATDQHARTWAAFADGDLAIAPRLTLTVGVRYTSSHRTFSGCSLDSGSGTLSTTFGVIQSVAKAALGLPPGPAPQPGGCFSLNAQFDPELTHAKLDEDNVAWRGGLKFEPNDATMVYANISRGFKAGQFPTILAARSFEFAPVRQEQLTAYEAGVKLSAFERRLDLSAAAFYYQYSDKQVRTRIQDPIFFQLEALANVPKADVAGAEAQLVARPIRGLNLSLAASYTDAQIRKFTGIDQFGVTRDFAHTALPFTPKWQGVADIEYRFPTDDAHEAFAGGTLSYMGPSNAFLGADPIGRLRSRTLLDLRAGYGARDGSWQAYVWGRNVTDQKYQTYVIRVTDTVIGYAGRPASFGVTLSYKYR